MLQFPCFPALRIRLILCISFCLLAGCEKAENRVVVYCAQDQEYAEGIFSDFTKESQLTISPKFDSEANKSVSLSAELEQEATRPRCDVHWNNEILGTIRLARKGVYEAYESPNSADFPVSSKAKDKTWQAFAERARVLIVNTNLVPEKDRPKSIFDLLDPKFRGKVAMAKPLFGSTATHAACLFDLLNPDGARDFFLALKTNGVQIVAGNKQAATNVSNGTFAIGLTDTDDALEELIAGKPVAIIFPDAAGHPAHSRLGTVFIPNTLALIKGAPNKVGARKLIDYLLQPATEKRLAEGGGLQFPINPKVDANMHPALRRRGEIKSAEVDFERAADLWDESITFMRKEFAQ